MSTYYSGAVAIEAQRNQRLRECVDTMRALWAGEPVTHAGMIDTYAAKLYRLPGYMPNVVGAALTEQTAAWVGGWANTMITSHIRSPEGFDAAGAMVKPEDMFSAVRISDSTHQQVEWLAKDIEAGLSRLFLHNVNLKQQHFITDFGAKVLSQLVS